jgi:hypothetical protein
MKVRTCASCAAPLGALDVDAASVACQFCGAVNEPTVLQRGVQQVQIVLDPSMGRNLRRASSVGAFTGLLILLAVLVGVGGAAFGVWTALHAAFPQQVPGLPGRPALTVASLAGLTGGGRQKVEVAAPAGGYAAVDPVAVLPWANDIARRWSADARLDRIDATRIGPGGLVDTAGDPDGEVVYRFVSPSRAEAYFKEADLRSGVRAQSEMWVVLARGAASVQAITSAPSSVRAVAPAPKVLSLADTLARNRASLSERKYKGYMIHSGSEGWVWYLSTLSGRESLPRIRAADGRSWPYGTASPLDAPGTASPSRAPGRAPKGYAR